MDNKWVTGSLIVASLICAFGFAYEPNWYSIVFMFFWLLVIMFMDKIDEHLINPLWRKK